MKLLTPLVSVLSLCASITAAPLEKRSLSDADVSTLQLAVFLEHLEFALYSGGYNAFDEAAFEADGFPPGFRDNVGVIASHESTHATAIANVLAANGVTAVPPCTYSFPYSTPTEFVSLANMITTVGIGAYLGGALSLTDSPTLLSTASAILTVEARHDAYLRTGLLASPFPTAYDTSLTATWAYNLASAFLVSCPTLLPLPLLPKLNFSGPAPPPPHLQPPVPAGTTLTFTWDPATFFVAVDPAAPLFIALVNQVTMVSFVPVTSCGVGCGTIPLPANITGVAFAVLTTFSTGLSEVDLTAFGTLAGPAEVVLS